MNIKDIKWFFDFSEVPFKELLEGIAYMMILAIFFIILMLIPA